MRDLSFLLNLADMLSNQICRVFYDIESPLLPVLTEMENNGIRIDPKAAGTRWWFAAENLQTWSLSWPKLKNLISFPKQLGVILFEEMQLVDKPKTCKTGQYKTDESLWRHSPPNILLLRKFSSTANPRNQPTSTPCPPTSTTDGRIHSTSINS